MEKFEIGREMLRVQGYDGNWDYDPYMHGMYNGMEFMLSMIEDRPPVFRDAPKKWKAHSKIKKLYFKIRRFFGLDRAVACDNQGDSCKK